MTPDTVTPDVSRALTPITQAQRMLAEAKSLPELKQLRDYAEGAKAWAKARGMGIGAENEAAEVVLRAERRIGQNLVDLGISKNKGGPFPASRRTRDGRSGKALQLVAVEKDAVTLKDLDITPQQSSHFQRLAKLPDESFERMLYSARSGGERLAKHNFYRGISEKPKRGSINRPTPETGESVHYAYFRAGAFGLLGWAVSEQGIGGPTENGLLDLPDDQLAEFASLVRLLVVAYNAAKEARA